MKTLAAGQPLASLELLRYPRTAHLQSSRLQADDATERVPLMSLKDAFVAIEEKLDGANCAVSFDASGELRLQSRGHYLIGGSREQQFSMLHTWAQTHGSRLLERLEDRYVMYGEWTYAKHSIYYDCLPHFFHEFDVWDRKEACFLSTRRRLALLAGLPVLSVPVLYEGEMPTRPKWLMGLVRDALGKSPRWETSLEEEASRRGLSVELCWRQTDRSSLSEGLYVKHEDDDVVLGRYKWVRADFVQTILDSGSHHSERPILPNRLAENVDLYGPKLSLTWAELGLETVRGLGELASRIKSENGTPHARRNNNGLKRRGG